MHIHAPEDRRHKSTKGMAGIHYPNSNDPQYQTHVITNLQNAPVTRGANGKLARVDTGELHLVSTLVTSPRCALLCHQGKSWVGNHRQAEQVRNREDPGNQRFWQLLGTTPRSPSQGQLAMRQQALHSLPGVVSWLRLNRGNPGSQISREHSRPMRAPKLFPKVGSNKEVRLLWRKVCFIFNAGKNFYRQREGATCINSTVSSGSHGNYGSSSHGYSLVIMWLTAHLVRVSVSITGAPNLWKADQYLL